MRISKYLLFILSLCLLASCRTVRNAEQSSKSTRLNDSSFVRSSSFLEKDSNSINTVIYLDSLCVSLPMSDTILGMGAPSVRAITARRAVVVSSQRRVTTNAAAIKDSTQIHKSYSEEAKMTQKEKEKAPAALYWAAIAIFALAIFAALSWKAVAK